MLKSNLDIDFVTLLLLLHMKSIIAPDAITITLFKSNSLKTCAQNTISISHFYIGTILTIVTRRYYVIIYVKKRKRI